MYLEAVEVMEGEGKESMALDIFRQAIGPPSPPALCPAWMSCKTFSHILLLCVAGF